MKDLSILIPGRNEMFLARTIEDILANMEADTEVIAVLDGTWADPPIPQHERVNVVYLANSIGQRAATNLACKLAKGKYVMKCDAHCAFDRGFDRKMTEAFKKSGDNVTMVPTMRNLWAFDWKCYKCGWKKYQGPTPGKCEHCNETGHIKRKMMWVGKEKPQSNSYCFDVEPHFQYFNEYTKRPEYRKDLEETGLTETMSLQGSCWMLTRDKYWELGVCDENFGSWGSQGVEVASKTWLSGGRVLVNHKTWYAHMFRTQGGDFGFPYPISGKDQEKAKNFAKDLFFNNKWGKQVHPLSWLIEKFWPVKGWTEEDLQKLKANTFQFSTKNLGVIPTESEPTEELADTEGDTATLELTTDDTKADETKEPYAPEGDTNQLALMLDATEARGETEELTQELTGKGGIYYAAVISGTNARRGRPKKLYKNDKVTIIGHGWVGKSVHKLFPDAYIFDPPTGSKRLANKSEIAFICVPTPPLGEGKLDTKIVEKTVAWCQCPLIVIRSTVNPGTCDYLSKKYKKRIIVQPEYLGETPAHPLLDEKSTPFIIIGGKPKDRRRLIDLYGAVYNANVKIRQVTALEAEVIKLTENRAIAFKVAQCQELYDVCEKAGIDYYTIRDAVYGDDPRFTLWWTFVYPDKRGFNSKCIVPETKVYTNSGHKLAKNVTTNDFVLTQDGTFQKVLQVMNRKVAEELVKITPQGLDGFVITKDHPILGVKTNRHYQGKIRRKLSNYYGDYNLEWIDAENLEKGDFITIPKVELGKKILNDSLLRLIGYYIAEGYCDAKAGKITFGFHAKESRHIEDIKQIVQKYFPNKKPRKYQKTVKTNIREYHIKNAYNLTLFNHELAEFLEKYGGKKHDYKRIHPSILFSGNISQLLKGYFRGDGSESDGIITMATTSEDLFYQIKMILWANQISFTTTIKSSYIINGVKHKKSYYLRIRNHTEIRKFNKLCGSKIDKNLKLLRKTTPIVGDKILVPIRNIVMIPYKGLVYNYEISTNNTYVVNDAIVHNCLPKDVYAWCAWAESLGYDPEITRFLLEANIKWIA